MKKTITPNGVNKTLIAIIVMAIILTVSIVYSIKLYNDKKEVLANTKVTINEASDNLALGGYNAAITQLLSLTNNCNVIDISFGTSTSRQIVDVACIKPAPVPNQPPVVEEQKEEQEEEQEEE